VIAADYQAKRNSANNKFNPDPDRTVYYGEMTWEEKNAPFVGVVVKRGVDIQKFATRNSPGLGG
jgi:hypothetical protein